MKKTDHSIKGCFTKKSYPNRVIANKLAREFSTKFEKNVRDYYCKHCTNFHLTTSKQLNETYTPSNQDVVDAVVKQMAENGFKAIKIEPKNDPS